MSGQKIGDRSKRQALQQVGQASLCHLRLIARAVQNAEIFGVLVKNTVWLGAPSESRCIFMHLLT